MGYHMDTHGLSWGLAWERTGFRVFRRDPTSNTAGFNGGLRDLTCDTK